MHETEQISFTEEIYRIQPPVMVIIDKPWQQLDEEYKVLLGKILVAIKLSLSSVTIIHQENLNLSELAERARLTMAFIHPPSGIPVYEPIRSGDTTTLVAEPLDAIAAQEDSKRKLWNCLKSIAQV
ncbi:MAG: DNA polymerase III subunit psi [Bacteroidetes bacterium]|nr:DNA polymerase III subunit psi [Bacteroidota bacterium]